MFQVFRLEMLELYNIVLVLVVLTSAPEVIINSAIVVQRNPQSETNGVNLVKA